MNRSRWWVLVSLMVVLLLAGCGGKNSSQGNLSTPQKAWDHYVSVMKAGDAKSFYSLLSATYIVNNAGASPADVLKKWESIIAVPDTYDKVKVQSIDQTGDQAVIKFALTGHPDYSGQIILVKEGGEWKLASGTAMKKLNGG